MKEETINKLLSLCEDYFGNPLIKEYAGAPYSCLFCLAVKQNDGKTTHAGHCPVLIYQEIIKGD